MTVVSVFLSHSINLPIAIFWNWSLVCLRSLFPIPVNNRRCDIPQPHGECGSAVELKGEIRR